MTNRDDCFEDRMATLWGEIDMARQSVETEARRARGKTKERLAEVSDLLLDASDLLPS